MAVAMIGVLFAGSMLVTPLYVIYEKEWGFSRITLTLIYAAYVIGNLAALLVLGRLSDHVGRRRTAVAVMGWPLSARWSSCSQTASPRSMSGAS